MVRRRSIERRIEACGHECKPAGHRLGDAVAVVLDPAATRIAVDRRRQGGDRDQLIAVRHRAVDLGANRLLRLLDLRRRQARNLVGRRAAPQRRGPAADGVRVGDEMVERVAVGSLGQGGHAEVLVERRHQRVQQRLVGTIRHQCVPPFVEIPAYVGTAQGQKHRCRAPFGLDSHQPGRRAGERAAERCTVARAGHCDPDLQCLAEAAAGTDAVAAARRAAVAAAAARRAAVAAAAARRAAVARAGATAPAVEVDGVGFERLDRAPDHIGLGGAAPGAAATGATTTRAADQWRYHHSRCHQWHYHRSTAATSGTTTTRGHRCRHPRAATSGTTTTRAATSGTATTRAATSGTTTTRAAASGTASTRAAASGTASTRAATSGTASIGAAATVTVPSTAAAGREHQRYQPGSRQGPPSRSAGHWGWAAFDPHVVSIRVAGVAALAIG